MSDPCESCLIPTVSSIKKDYSIAQAYAYVNAKNDYEKIKNGSGSNTSLDVVYKAFAFDLKNSNSAEQFEERVRQKLTTMQFSMDEQSAESHYRRGLEEFQVDDWLECQRIHSNSNASKLLLYVQKITRDSAAVVVRFQAGFGVPPRQLLIVDVSGAKIKDKADVQEMLETASERTYLVEKKQDTSEALVTAKAGGLTQTIHIDFAHIANQGGMLGDTISITRCSPTADTPYPNWTPSRIDVTAFAAPTRWIAAGTEHMNISVTKKTILFEITQLSQYFDYGAPGFDGFVLRNFDRKIKSVTLSNNAPLEIEIKHTDEEVSVDIRGRSPAGKSFSLNMEFVE